MRTYLNEHKVHISAFASITILDFARTAEHTYPILSINAFQGDKLGSDFAKFITPDVLKK